MHKTNSKDLVAHAPHTRVERAATPTRVSCATTDPVKREPTIASSLSTKEILLILAVAGFGFLIDVYDSVLFAVVRVNSLHSLGITGDGALSTSVLLFNMQMSGMIVGGLLWGVLGDKKGRKAALFGSILLYSLANFANAFVTDIPMFAALRFLSGIGLAGEVGAAMTVAAEVMPRKYRIYGTTAVSTLGIAGALLASLVGGTIDWRLAFVTAGMAGFFLLMARLSMKEPPVFARIARESSIKRGDLKLLLNKQRFLRLLRCVLAAVPLFFVFGVLVSFAPEVWHGSGDKGFIAVASLVMCYSIGETLGELFSGLLSHVLRSRKKVMLIFLCSAMICTLAILNCPANMYALLCVPLGFFVGYWGVVMTATAEQFGTNLRSTATTLVPNLMRACVIPINFTFAVLCQHQAGHVSAMMIGAVCMLLALVSVLGMDETCDRELDFIES